MSDMHRARKARVNDRVSSLSGERSALSSDRSALSGERSALSGERSAIQKAPWQELAEARGSEDKTKNFVVPAELIALARSNLSRRPPAREPFAAKPTLVVPIVVPPAAIPSEKRAPPPPPATAPVEPPVTTLKAKVAPFRERLARSSSQPPGREPSRRPPPFEPSKPPAAFQAPRRPPAFESWRPAPASIQDAVPESGEPSPLRAYAPFLTAAVIVGAYVGLCYFANTLIAWLP